MQLCRAIVVTTAASDLPIAVFYTPVSNIHCFTHQLIDPLSATPTVRKVTYWHIILTHTRTLNPPVVPTRNFLKGDHFLPVRYVINLTNKLEKRQTTNRLHMHIVKYVLRSDSPHHAHQLSSVTAFGQELQAASLQIKYYFRHKKLQDGG